MKNCSGCKLTKELTCFGNSKTSRDGKKYLCNACERLAKKRYYDSHKNEYKYRTAQGKKERRLRFQLWKNTLKCEACGESESVCLDFHHSDPLKKDFVISEIVASHAWDTLMHEVDKCKVLCATCHRKVHLYGFDELMKRRHGV